MFVLIFSESQFRSLLENHLALQLVNEFVNEFFFTSKQDVITVSPTC